MSSMPHKSETCHGIRLRHENTVNLTSLDPAPSFSEPCLTLLVNPQEWQQGSTERGGRAGAPCSRAQCHCAGGELHTD